MPSFLGFRMQALDKNLKFLKYLVLDVVEEVGEGILLVVGHDVTDGEHPVPEHSAHLEDQQEDESHREEKSQGVQPEVFVVQLDEVGLLYIACVEGYSWSLSSE